MSPGKLKISLLLSACLLTAVPAYAQFSSGAEISRSDYWSLLPNKAGYGPSLNSVKNISPSWRIGVGIAYTYGASFSEEVFGDKIHPDTTPLPPGTFIFYSGYYLPVEAQSNIVSIPLSLAVSLLHVKEIKTRLLLNSAVTFNHFKTKYHYRFDTSVYYQDWFDVEDNETKRYWETGVRFELQLEKQWRKYIFYSSYSFGLTKTTGLSRLATPFYKRLALGVNYVLKDKEWPEKNKRSERLKEPQKSETPKQRAKREKREADDAKYRTHHAFRTTYLETYKNRSSTWASGIYYYRRNYRISSANPGIGLIYHSPRLGEAPAQTKKGFMILEGFESFNIQGQHISLRLMPILGLGFNSQSVFLGSRGVMAGLGLSVWRFEANVDAGIYNTLPALRFSVGYVMSGNTHLKVREPFNPPGPMTETAEKKLAAASSKWKENTKKDKAAHPSYHGLRTSALIGSYYNSNGFSLTWFRRNYRIFSISPLAGLSYVTTGDYSYKPPYGYQTTRDVIIDAGGMMNLQGRFMHLRVSGSVAQAFHKGGAEFTGGLMLGAGFNLWRIETNFEIGLFHYSDTRLSVGYVFSDNKKLRVR